MFRSATFKLTLWYICLVVAISLIFSAVLYNVASTQIASGLMHESARIYNQFPVFDNNPILRPRADIASAEHRLLLRLLLFNLLVIIAAGFGSYALARRTLQPIEEAHEQQKRFTADVSHELRTPLTALKMESEVALMNPKIDVAELRHTLESNLEEADKLEVLINNLLRLTRLEAEELRHQFVPVDVHSVVMQAITSVQKIADARSITIKYHATDLIINADEASIVQLLVTLLDNALKYSAGGTLVSLTVMRQDSSAHFSIIDHGIGIAPNDLKNVFNRFYRADNARTKGPSGGFGLGLSIAKMIADVHKGTIIITSRESHGTTVDVTIPLATVPA
jgi:two-component system sensor histidine kinase CiaH